MFGVARLTDRFDLPDMDASQLGIAQTTFMGQFLLNPPSVGGWHEGEEWIDSGALVERINFASTELERRDAPGIQANGAPRERGWRYEFLRVCRSVP